MRLLVVDWDYFCAVVERPEDGDEWVLYDWGHDEAQEIFFEDIWPSRAAGFIASDLPLPDTSGEELGFWRRFNINPRAQLFVADSNMWAAHARINRFIDDLWLYDAHHDAGYRDDALRDVDQANKQVRVTCEDWMIAYGIQGTHLHMRYPRWRYYGMEGEPVPHVKMDRRVDDGEPVDVPFDRVFVCRSPAWTAPWLDATFQEFIEAAPVARTIPLHGMKPLRDFDRGAAEEIAGHLRAVRERR